MDNTPHQTERKPGFIARLGGELKRLVVLGSILAALVVAGKYYCFDRLDEEIRARFESQLREHYSGLEVNVRSARRIPGQGVEIRGIVIAEGAGAKPAKLVEIAEVFVACDTRLPDFITKPLQISRLELRRMKLRAERKPHGFWNLAHVLPLPGFGGGGTAPTATITDATLEIVDPTQDQPCSLTLRNIEVTVRPEATAAASAGESAFQLHMQGSLAGDHFDRLQMEGWLDPRTAAFALSGSVEGLEFSPRLRAGLPHEISKLLAPVSSVRGRSQFGFQMTRGGRVASRPAPPTQFMVSGSISEGRIDDARLPEPLRDVEATIRCDNQGVTIQNLSARCGTTQLKLDAEVFGYSLASPLRLNLQADGLILDRLPTTSFPDVLHRVWATFQPRGVIDLTAQLEFDGRAWKPHLTARCRDLSVEYARFPYRLVGGAGKIELRHDRLTAGLWMLAGSQVVHCRADVQRPGPDFAGWVEVNSERPLMINEQLLEALEPRFQSVVRAFHPRGELSFFGRLERRVGETVIHRNLRLTLHDCSVQHDRFSYPIDKVNGLLELTDSDWAFTNLSGRNDSAYIVGRGSWRAAPADGNQLSLDFTATDVPLADELRVALEPGAQRLWANLRPRGNIDHLVVGMKFNAVANALSVEVKADKWAPGQNLEGRTISIEPAAFRYRLDNLTGSVHYHNGLMELRNLQALHGRTMVEAEGVCHMQEGTCYLQLARLSADRVVLDQELLAALPGGLGAAVAKLNLQGSLNVVGKMGVTVPQNADQQHELDWDLSLDVDNGRLAGLTPIEQLYGGVRLVGSSGPRGLFSRGELAFESAMIRDVQLTEISGPLVIDGQRILFGSAAERDVQGRVPRQVTATVFDGLLSIDGEASLLEENEFKVQATLSNADLATIMREVAPQRSGLTGKVFGLVNMTGNPSGAHTWRGDGNVRLRDADIYELPVMISMLKLLSVQRPNRTAFTTSNIDFRIEGDDLALDRIDFNGDAICLKGKGRINRQRQIDLKFYPQMGRDEYHLPIFRPLVGEASRQFMLIQVTGTLDQPEVNRRVFPQIDEQLQQLFPELARPDSEPEPARPIMNMPRNALRRAGLIR